MYLVPVPQSTAAITQVVPHTYYQGGHPTAILSDDNHAGFVVTVAVDIYSNTANTEANLTVVGAWPGALPVTTAASLAAGDNTVNVTIPASQTIGVRLWHPHGHGDHPLYNITATLQTKLAVSGSAGTAASTSSTRHASAADSTVTATVTATRRLGFRHVALVTVNDTDPRVVAAGGKGTGQLTMFFRVNGASVYARGGNKVPMDLLDGRMDAEAHRQLVRSAAEGNMNTLRVWGGGIWEPRAFWDAADEYGILLYTDMQFTWGTTGAPHGTASESAELEYQLKRLSHHPSVAMWDGCNECGGGGLYESFVMPTVAKFDTSRPIWYVEMKSPIVNHSP